ncbi:hypothetical protein PLESTF_000584700 [Pleodorina starrii]|nr:hypothetical protein PLESTF_000584700 [Pleodorina starrii]
MSNTQCQAGLIRCQANSSSPLLNNSILNRIITNSSPSPITNSIPGLITTSTPNRTNTPTTKRSISSSSSLAAKLPERNARNRLSLSRTPNFSSPPCSRRSPCCSLPTAQRRQGRRHRCKCRRARSLPA